jgi:enoyl-[acyl-carrier protein] reductase II
MAGQSVGLVKEIKPLKTIIDEMVVEAEAELQRLKRLFAEAAECL